MADSTQYHTSRKRKGRATKAKANGANLGFEEKLWLTADKLRTAVFRNTTARFK